MTDMKASVLLTLNDQLSGPLDRLMGSLDRLNGTIGRLAGVFEGLDLGAPFAGMTKPIDRAGEHLDKLGAAAKALDIGAPFAAADKQIDTAAQKIGSFQEKLNGLREGVPGPFASVRGAWNNFSDQVGPLGGAAAVAGVVAPVERYADYDAVLRQIAITEHLHGAAADAEIARLRDLFAHDAQRTGQLSTDIARAYLDFVTTGLNVATTDRVIGQHSEAATAYGISPETLGPGVIALLNNLKIPEGDVLAAVGAMAEAAKSGRFKVTDFAAELPAVTSMMQAFGMQGRAAADFGFAALETAMKGQGLPSSAAAGVVDALNYLTSRMANHSFARAGIDLPALLLAGERAGKNPLDTILDKLAQMTHGQSAVQMQETLHGVLHNQQAEQAVLALLQHRDELKALTERLDRIDATAVNADFLTAFSGPAATVKLFDENLAQATRAVGQDFTPGFEAMNAGLHVLAVGMRTANDDFPILTHALGIATVALAGLAAAAGVRSLVGDYVAQGAKLGMALLGGAAGTAGVGAALIVAEYTAFLARERGKLLTEPAYFNPQAQKLEVHVSADPGLAVQVRRLGTGSVPLTIGSPLDPHGGFALDPSNRLVGRD